MEVDSGLKTDKALDLAEKTIKSSIKPTVTEDIEATNRQTAPTNESDPSNTDLTSRETNSTSNDEPPQEEDVSMKEGEAEEVVEY